MLLKYRKDIDGLRAIAVALVVLFHAKLPVSGGFVGVDVFFVISGFLIASLIQKQILKGKFTFKGFYLHRMRRILPALLLVLLVTFIFSWFMLLPLDFRFFIRSLFYSICSYSNIFFYRHGKQYFSQDADNVQLLHTWSLSVEEQFYIIVPIFLILMYKYFHNKKIFDVIMGGLLLSSFGFSCYLSKTNPSFAYLLLPARFFELFIGVWLALYYEKLPVLKNNKFNDILSIVALLLIVIPAFVIIKDNLFPGPNALYVCLGSVMLIYLGKAERTPLVNRIISLKPFVFVGLISYSLYLWHWVVFSSINILGIHPSLVSKIGIIVSLIFVSYLSWKFVEQPFRNKFKWEFRKTFVVLFALPLIISCVFNTVSKQNNTFADYRFTGDLLEYAKTSGSRASRVKRYCHSGAGAGVPNPENCYLGNKNKKDIDVLLAGDSHANSIAGFVEMFLKNSDLRGYPATYSSTMFLPYVSDEDISKMFRGRTISEESVKGTLSNFREIMEGKSFEYVVLAGFYDSYYQTRDDFKDFKKYFAKSIEYVLSKDATPVIINDVISIRTIPYCKVLKEKINLNKDCDTFKVEDDILVNEVDRYFNDLKERYPEIILINPKDIMCNEGRCSINMDNTSLYYDKQHLTYAGSKLLGQKYLDKFGNPFDKVK